jgi:hypothetical protein
LIFSHSIPPAIVDIGLKLPRNKGRHAVAQPQVPQRRVVALLVEEELPPVAEAHVHLTIPVNVRRMTKRTREL